MSTLAAADLPSSDEEGDADFVPSARPAKRRKITKSKTKAKEGSGSDSASSGSSSDDDEDGDNVDDEEAKRLKAEADAVDAEERRRKAAEAFAAFNEPVSSAGGSGGVAESTVEKEEMVAVKRERKFAGEVIHETVMLPKSHPEAVAFLASKSDSKTDTQPQSAESSTLALEINGSARMTTTPSAEPGPSTGSAPTPNSASNLKPLTKGPIRRKPRQSLEALSAGLAGGKKMTTLEKSQMDWKSHVESSANVSDELESNRRSGGFLEKRDFLERVGDRRNETLESKRKAGR